MSRLNFLDYYNTSASTISIGLQQQVYCRLYEKYVVKAQCGLCRYMIEGECQYRRRDY
jgi:hypothetical protein